MKIQFQLFIFFNKAAWETSADRQCSAYWPENGRITFRDYSTRYRPGLDLVLKGISYDVQQAQRVIIIDLIKI